MIEKSENDNPSVGTVDLNELLREQFGFDSFRSGQREVIENLLAGRSAVAVFPTGSGKSLCYQLPALLLPGVTLVVSPLIALMKDQIDALTQRGVQARRLDSTLSADEYRDVMVQVREGQLRLLYVAPERFNNERFRETILRTRVSLFAIDEAHCISEWGHNFRPDYLKLAAFARMSNAERVLGLTATATPQVVEDMCRVFEIPPECATCTGFYRPNLRLLTTPVAADDRDALLLEKLQQRPAGPTIVYVTLQRTAEEVADRLASAGLPAKAYHAGMKDDLRSAVQDWFMAADRGIVVATIAFGMGVDKPNIRYVYHYNLPKSLENYSQEIGRAGRDGATSTCETLACSDDLNVLENFVYGDTPAESAVASFVRAIFSAGEDFDVSYYELSQQHELRLLVVRTLLTYLELDGYLEGGTPFYAGYQFKPLMPSAKILSHFEGPRREFLSSLLKQARKASTWFRIDLDQAAAKLNEPRERLVRALDYLGEQQMLELKVQGVRNRFRRLKTPADLTALARSLQQKMVDREAKEVERLDQVIALVEREACQVAALCAHFGERLDKDCGHCSWCLDNQATRIPERRRPPIDDRVLAQAVALQEEYPNILAEPLALTRLLCGISSPQFTRQKLTAHQLFGCFAEHPFKEVLAKITR
mgnify:FL=1